MQRSIIVFVVAAICIVTSEAYHNIKGEADLDQQIKDAGNKPIVIDFYRTWLPSCKINASYLESYKRPYAGKFVFLRVHLDEFADLARKRFGIDGPPGPAYVFMKNGKIVKILKPAPDNPGMIDIIMQDLIKS